MPRTMATYACMALYWAIPCYMQTLRTGFVRACLSKADTSVFTYTLVWSILVWTNVTPLWAC